MINRRAIMRKMAMAAVLMLAACTSTEEPAFPANVNVGVTPSSPGWNLRDSAGGRSGFDHALVEWLGAELKFNPIEVDVLTENRERDLKSKMVSLVVANYSITDHRLEQVEIVGPYMRTRQGVLIRKTDVKRYRSIRDLAGATVCVTSGSTSLDQVQNSLGVRVAIRQEKVYEDCRRALHEGHADVVSTDQLMLFGIASADDKVTVVPEIVFGKEERYGVGLPLGDKVRCELLREKLRKFLTDGSWEKFFKEYFPAVNTVEHKPDPDRLSECR